MHFLAWVGYSFSIRIESVLVVGSKETGMDEHYNEIDGAFKELEDINRR